MTICCQNVTKQVKIRGFSTTKIENSDLAILTRYENFPHKNWYHKATVPISTVIYTLCTMSWCNVMELIQNWDNQNQQAMSLQMRYNLSGLNNQNYQTLSIKFCWLEHMWCVSIPHQFVNVNLTCKHCATAAHEHVFSQNFRLPVCFICHNRMQHIGWTHKPLVISLSADGDVRLLYLNADV